MMHFTKFFWVGLSLLGASFVCDLVVRQSLAKMASKYGLPPIKSVFFNTSKQIKAIRNQASADGSFDRLRPLEMASRILTIAGILVGNVFG